MSMESEICEDIVELYEKLSSPDSLSHDEKERLSSRLASIVQYGILYNEAFLVLAGECDAFRYTLGDRFEERNSGKGNALRELVLQYDHLSVYCKYRVDFERHSLANGLAEIKPSYRALRLKADVAEYVVDHESVFSGTGYTLHAEEFAGHLVAVHCIVESLLSIYLQCSSRPEISRYITMDRQWGISEQDLGVRHALCNLPGIHNLVLDLLDEIINAKSTIVSRIMEDYR